MSASTIEWTNMTWNPVTGCTKVSPGCNNCYAERFSNRLKSMLEASNQYEKAIDDNGNWSSKITVVEEALEKPLHWRKPRRVFVNSMSDLFHEDVPLSFIRRVFDVMKKCPRHVFQILTKRPERMLELSSELDWPPQVWAGTSVENDDYSWRIDELRNVPAEICFLSLEPLIGSLEAPNFENIDWVIVGGESGPKARPMDPDWVLDIFEACRNQDVPFFFKQWGAYGPDGKKRSKKENGREFKGETWDEMPGKETKTKIGKL